MKPLKDRIRRELAARFGLEQLGVFLEYRRLLLYTVLQGCLSNDKEANEAFMSMITK